MQNFLKSKFNGVYLLQNISQLCLPLNNYMSESFSFEFYNLSLNLCLLKQVLDGYFYIDLIRHDITVIHTHNPL